MVSPFSAVSSSPENRPAAFAELDTPALVSERRGFLAAADSTGKKWIVGFVRDIVGDLGARTSLLMIDPESGKTGQFYYPDPERANGDVFCLFLSSKGKLYATIGNTFLEFDLDGQKFTFADTRGTSKTDRLCFSMSEGRDGKIYFASYPHAQLEVYDPGARTVKEVCQLDPSEKYPTTLSVADDGWVYAGLGTVKRTLIAYNLKTGERRQLVPEEQRGTGYAVVLKDKEKIYASFGPEQPFRRPFRLLENGAVTDTVNEKLSIPSAKRPPNSLYAFNIALKFPDGSRVEDFDLITKSFVFKKADGTEEKKHFDYASNGASISAIAQGVDGKIYGCTDHPMVLWEYDPELSQSRVLGHVKKIGGGNMVHLVSWKGLLVSNTYSRGDLYAFDPLKPFKDGEQDGNPVLLDSTHPLIGRPRAMVCHSDGRHIISAGWPGYGHVGGGMLIYDMESRQKTALLEPGALSPGQSISALAVLPDGDLIFGTSIITPGGGDPQTKEVKVGRFNWEDKKTEWLATPLEKADTIFGLIAAKDRVFGLDNNGTLFEFDLQTHKTVRQMSLSTYGQPVGRRGDTTFFRLPDGRILILMTKTVLEFEPGSFEVRPIARSPVALEDGAAFLDGKLYLASWSKLLAVEIPPAVEKVNKN